MPLALITGASTGIGRASALRLAGSGWRVLAGVRDPSAGERLVTEANADGRIVPLELDVTNAGQIAAAAELVREHGASGRFPLRGLDALVNNAGIGVGGPLELVELDSLRAQFEVNVFGQVAVTRALLPALRAARGRIVFLSSVGGRVAVPFSAPYGASKHAIEAIADCLRGELQRMGVRVALIEPGSVRTPIWSKSKEQVERLQVPPEFQAEYGHVRAAFTRALRDTELRGIPPEEVAAAVQRALTDRRPRARYVVGREAKVMLLAHALLPTSAFDRLVRRELGI